MGGVMGRIYSNRQPQGPSYNYDNRISSQQANVIPGQFGGVLPFPGVKMPTASTGQLALTMLAVGVLAVIGFNVWTHAYQK